MIVRADGAGAAPWEGALCTTHVALTPGEVSDARQALAGADCVLLDAGLPDVLGHGRRIRELEPPLQVLIVADAEARTRLEHAMLFVPGLGEVWVVEAEQLRPELLDRARAITAQRRAYRETRTRLRHELAALGMRAASRTHVSDAYLAALLSVLPDPVISIDAEDCVLTWNSAAGHVFGVAGAQEAGRSLQDVLGVVDPSRLSHLLGAAAAEAPARAEFELDVGGRARTAEITVIPVEAAGYRVRAVVVHEVTEERRARAELVAQTDELQQQSAQLAEAHVELELANRELRHTIEALAERTLEAESARAEADAASRAKSEFLATMSHEIRTPINAIIGYTQLLEIGVAGPLAEQQRAFLERVHFSSRHLLTLIEDILDLARIEAGRTELTSARVPAARTVASALALVGPQAQARQIRLVHATKTDQHTSFEGDERRVRQILVNLLSNAIRFTDPGGQITVSHGVAAATLPTINGRSGPWTYIRVADTGVGIAPADLERVFLPFEQAEQGYTRSKGGTGLGLAISLELAQLMGGDVTAESQLGRGSTFTLWLPQHPREGAAHHPRSAIGESLTANVRNGSATSEPAPA